MENGVSRYLLSHVYTHYNRLRYLAHNIHRELIICNQYLYDYRIFLINNRQKYRTLFVIATSRNKISVNDAILIDGKLKSPTVDVIYLIKRVIKSLIQFEDDIRQYIAEVHQKLNLLIKGLCDYSALYLFLMSDILQ